MRIVEQPSGRGLLVGDGVKAQVSYTLRVTEEAVPVGTQDDPGATIPGLRSIDGHVEFDDVGQQAGLLGETLTLHLKDGRRLSVIMTGQGRIKGAGGFSGP